jgi:hypothetical protein
MKRTVNNPKKAATDALKNEVADKAQMLEVLCVSKREKYRIEPVGVFSKEGLDYLAIEPELIKQEGTTFFVDIQKIYK